ncbi:MAG: hypothetical protein D6698_16525 [Gammaproteobacteria bacterium]|nr:MAG: hypothetical protein D6698_16525 [Gammaproteobacteria bacterium]
MNQEFKNIVEDAFKYGVATEFVPATDEDGNPIINPLTRAPMRQPKDPRSASAFMHVGLYGGTRREPTLLTTDTPHGQKFRQVLEAHRPSVWTVNRPQTDEEGNLVEVEVRGMLADGSTDARTRHVRTDHHLLLVCPTKNARDTLKRDLLKALPDLKDFIADGEKYVQAVPEEVREDLLNKRILSPTITGLPQPTKPEQILAIWAAPNPQGLYMNPSRTPARVEARTQEELESSDIPF